MPSISEFAYFSAQEAGWLPDGTDRSTEALALLTTVYNAGGGAIFFAPSTGTYRADNQLLIPNNGLSQPRQPSIKFIGAGPGPLFNYNTTLPTGPSVLDLRYTASDGNAKIETRGLGVLSIEDLAIMDGGSANATPFIHTTNTTLLTSKVSFKGSGSATQDAIVLGGPSSTVSDGSVDAPFQGYGTVIERCGFSKLNRGVFGLTYANAVVIRDNAWGLGATGTRAIEFDGTNGGGCAGNLIIGNVIEMDVYLYSIYGTAFTRNLIVGNGFFDGNVALANIYLSDSRSTFNTIIRSYDQATPFIDGHPSALKTTNILGGDGFGLQLASTYPNDFAQLRLTPNGGAPGTLTDGDFWYDGTSLKFRQGNTTKTVTLS